MAFRTFKFKSIFPSYNDFKRIVADNSFIEIDDATLSYIWNVLARQYKNSEVMYYEKDAFIDDFMNVLEDEYSKIKKEKELITKIHALTDEELLEVNRSLNNFANNPNDEPDDPLKPLNFVSSQNFNIIKSDKLSSYLEALNKMPSLRSRAIIDAFRRLFVGIHNPTTFMYDNKEGD